MVCNKGRKVERGERAEEKEGKGRRWKREEEIDRQKEEDEEEQQRRRDRVSPLEKPLFRRFLCLCCWSASASHGAIHVDLAEGYSSETSQELEKERKEMTENEVEAIQEAQEVKEGEGEHSHENQWEFRRFLLR